MTINIDVLANIAEIKEFAESLGDDVRNKVNDYVFNGIVDSVSQDDRKRVITPMRITFRDYNTAKLILNEYDESTLDGLYPDYNALFQAFAFQKDTGTLQITHNPTDTSAAYTLRIIRAG